MHLCCKFPCLVAFHLSFNTSYNAHEGRKLIESIYHKNNNYLLTARAYEDDKTLALAKAREFRAVVSSKTNRKLPWLYNKQIYTQRNNIEQYFLS